MLRILIFFLSNLISHINGNHFTFDAVSLITSSDNWLNEEIPCIGDRIRFDNSMPVVAFMDHNVDVESIHLPNNGLIVFTDNGANFGDDVHWQCAKDNLEEPKDVFFTRGNGRDISFYNPKNWIPDRKLFLHMNQVPSEVDDVTVSSMSSAQIYLDLPVKVNTFRFYKRERMTTDDFNLLLRSMEGQFQINLARPWAKESDQGGVQRMIADDAITVKNKELAEDIRGIVNTNSNKKILSTICSYIACQDIQGQCVDFFKPFGHCCYVCGTQINFFASELHLDKSRAMVFNVLSEMEVTDTVFSTFERKTDDQLGSEYEIAVISSHNITFDEDFHKKARDEIVRRLLSISSNKFPTVSSMKLFSSKIDRTIRTLSKVVACLIYFSVVITLVGVYAYKNMELRVSRKNLFNPVIKYRRHQDDVAIEMEGGVEEETENVEPREEILENQKEEKTIENPEVIVKEEEKLENVEDWRNINPNFELTGSSDDVENQISYEMTETVKRENSDVDVKRESPDCTELIRETEKSYVAPFESIDTLETDYLTSFENPDVQEKDEEEKEVEKDMGSAVEEQNEDVANIFDINPNFEEEEDTSEPDSDIARDVELPQITVTSGTSSDVDPEAEPEKTVGKENKDVTESEEVELMDLL